eukprot:9248260-Karenia_brevis.AAC.1
MTNASDGSRGRKWRFAFNVHMFMKGKAFRTWNHIGSTILAHGAMLLAIRNAHMGSWVGI